MAFAVVPPKVLLKDILALTNEFSIVSYYLNLKELPTIILSPLRQDKHPSFSIFTTDGVHIKFKDFGTGECGGCFDLLGKIWGKSFREVLDRVYADLPKIGRKEFHGIQGSPNTNNRIGCSKHSNLAVRIREWNERDLKYWESYGISRPWLDFGRVFPVDYIFFEKKRDIVTIPADEYAYAFFENKDNQATVKIYQPFGTYKWLNNHDSSVWSLWEQLPSVGDNLIITSSTKDALSIWENTGIPACSLQSEAQLPKEHVIEELKSRFKTVFVLYDNDFTKDCNPGRSYGKRLADTFGLIQLELPEKLGAKDSSDLCKMQGRKVLRNTILTLIYSFYGKRS